MHTHQLFPFKGYLHEQSRKDRDKYVTIKTENIQSNYLDQFDKCETCDLQNSPYDYNSVMHYGATAFTKNGQPTIEVKNGQVIGQRFGFSPLDIKGINELYCGKYIKIQNQYIIYVIELNIIVL